VSRSWRGGGASQLKVRRPQVRDNRVGTKTVVVWPQQSCALRPALSPVDCGDQRRDRDTREPPHQKSFTRAKPRVARLVTY